MRDLSPVLVLLVFFFELTTQDPLRFRHKRSVQFVVDGTERQINSATSGSYLMVGDCYNKYHKLLHYEDTAIENSGPSTLNGTLEFYIDGQVLITCVKAVDKVADGSGMIGLNSGGVGHNWVFLDVAGKYGRGFHWYITIYGFDRKKL